MALGVAHTCALVEGGAVLCWGANGAGQLGDGTHTVRSRPASVVLPGAATSITAGDRHSCAIVDGRAWCWGWNARGQLGDGVDCAPDDEDCTERSLPVRVALDVRTEAIDAGSQHTCAVGEGRVHCWGANDVGQLGDGTSRSSARPVRVSGIDDASALTVGANHACVLRREGAAWCWGRNAQGQLGDGTRRDGAVPVRADPVIAGTAP
jgi:alpha-tubulin suppressor-like RCC1 family protein